MAKMWHARVVNTLPNGKKAKYNIRVDRPQDDYAVHFQQFHGGDAVRVEWTPTDGTWKKDTGETRWATFNADGTVKDRSHNGDEDWHRGSADADPPKPVAAASTATPAATVAQPAKQ